MIDVNELFETCDQESLIKGYTKDTSSGDLVCLICGKRYGLGEVFAEDGHFYTTEKMITIHVEKVHGSILDYLLNLDKKSTGLSDQQTRIIRLITEGFTDLEIADEIGDITSSTVRNHRFILREKARQSRVFLAIMNFVESSIQDKKKFVKVHRYATNIDERYQVTEEENEKLLSRYMDKSGKILQFPAKEKVRLMLIRRISMKFKFEQKYSEKEVNEILKPLYNDYVLIRRLMIDYGLLDRKADGSEYWLK